MKKQSLTSYFDQWKGILFCTAFIILMAQMNINLIINGFKISMAIIFLPVLMFLVEDFRTLPVTLLSAPGVFVVRCALEWFHGDTLAVAVSSYAPEMAFFLLYGGMFALYTKYVDFKQYRLWYFAPLILIDFCSNLGEMIVRVGDQAFRWNILSSLLIVAVCRSILAAVILGTLDYYGLFMLKKDDQERYKKLLLLIAQLKSEVVWMDKNTTRIEDTMAVSYRLYNELSAANLESAAQQALTVAKDVHEIKKEYYLIMRGISNALDLDMEENGMWSKTIFQILQESITREAQESGKQVRIVLNQDKNFYTDKHYFLMSVFRNLINNAVEAAGDKSAQITVSCKSLPNDYCFTVQDQCGGIPTEYLDSIFVPGFSTKISYETGEVSRGLGLCLVRDIVEEQLGGTMQVESQNGGTTFTIRIPKQNLEVLTK